MLGALPPHMAVPGRYPWLVVGCSCREAECQCSRCSQPSCTSCRGATSPREATGCRDLLQRPQLSIFKWCCACAVSRRTKSTQSCRRWCCGSCLRHRCGGVDALWCHSQPGSSCPRGRAGAVRAAANKDLERAELLWLRARLACQGPSSTSRLGSRCSEHLENW